ncbi:MAG: mannitol dehydrogenase family protein [Pseudomonadales bacterium]
MNQLSDMNLTALQPGVNNLGYDRTLVDIGIVHFGPGAFHRAHQAVYTDDLLRLQGGNWGICEVSVNSPTFRDAVREQDNLYTLAILDRNPSQQIIGAIKEVLVAPENPAAVIDRLGNPQTQAVTLTITEKGYCLTPAGKLDSSHEGIQHDITHLDRPKTAIGYLVAGLRKRREDGSKPFVVISCDNLTDNGQRLRNAVMELAAKIDPQLAQWITQEVYFPCTMVDSITPATDDLVRDCVSQEIGLRDNWPVQREGFTQWVIEDLPGAVLPPWNLVGATFSNDVQGFEAAKLRILNGTHSSLAFAGLLAGCETVEQAIGSDYIRAYIDQMLQREIIPTIQPVEGLDLQRYAREILARFENPAIRHFLSQIAWDSSQKIPFRLLGTIQDNLLAGRSCDLQCLAVAAWMRLIQKMSREQQAITDPLSARLQQIGQCEDQSDESCVDAFLSITDMFPPSLAADLCFRQSVMASYSHLAPANLDVVDHAMAEVCSV